MSLGETLSSAGGGGLSMGAPTVEQVLRASRWEDLGLPRTGDGLRAARTLLHPDVNREPNASDAFARLQGLFESPEFHVRVARGARTPDRAIEWTPEPGFDDLADVALKASTNLRAARHPRFFTSARRTPTGLRVEYGLPGERWWFLREFADLDGRTVVWVAKRLAAALAQAHNADWVHGDVNPDTVAILPAEHGLQLDGWWYGVREGEKMSVRPTSPHTPPRYLAGYPADAMLSVAQGAGMLRKLVRKGEPPEIASVLAQHAVKPGRPSQLFKDMETAALKAYGKPSWHELTEPSVDSV